ncbi:S8 family serine peptidase [Aquabacterium humicola]|uniref:S8 family serine peptidase n=1 Tax=Aquabacterium humicola TaxID=3237377 RepID=UPI0025435316|nr:S8 family serine peptidase [Rubrivivax pictus]
MKAALALVALVLAAAVLPARAADAGTADEAGMRDDSRRFIVLAVDNPLQRVPTRAGSSLPAYAPPPQAYVVGAQAAATLAALQREHRLQPAAAWPIPALGLHCVVLALPEGASREALLATLAADARVRLAQPLQDFELLATPASVPAPYNDPYLSLQRGFAETAAAAAHRASTGRDVAIAVIDTGADARHPDLQGRIGSRRDLVGDDAAAFDGDRHGTEVAGVIAAVANNAQGIAGIAPDARLALYKACWYTRDGAARCNSFTLAKALAAVLDSDARIVNLSLGGPADPLLSALLQQVLRQRRIVIAALPRSGRAEGFPAGAPGVLVVGSVGDDAADAGALAAPGRDVLTLVPGGRYDFASGSSIAAAHASGIAALLLSLQPQLDAQGLRGLLAPETGTPRGASINAGAAVARLAALRRRTAWP